MPNRKVNPTKPRQADAVAYERRLRAKVLNRIEQDFRENISRVASIEQAYNLIDDASNIPDLNGLVEDEVALFLTEVQGYHKERLIRSFNYALGIDILPVMTDPPALKVLTNAAIENAKLIVTIPERYREGLKENITQAFFERPFDRQHLKRILRDTHKSQGYNLRRITRDQNNKLVGQLTEVRHGQLNIPSYEWGSIPDSRRRPTHKANSGNIFYWANPPEATGHPGNDIQCRCFAIPIIPENFRI